MSKITSVEERRLYILILLTKAILSFNYSIYTPYIYIFLIQFQLGRERDVLNLENPRSSHCPMIRPGPALGCNYCWNTIDGHGRILRRKTKYHCPECQTNLCIVPCFQEYHARLGGAGSVSQVQRPISTATNTSSTSVLTRCPSGVDPHHGLAHHKSGRGSSSSSHRGSQLRSLHTSSRQSQSHGSALPWSLGSDFGSIRRALNSSNTSSANSISTSTFPATTDLSANEQLTIVGSEESAVSVRPTNIPSISATHPSKTRPH